MKIIVEFYLNFVDPKAQKNEDNTYEVEFSFPDDYPFKPPKIIFKTPIIPLFPDDNEEQEISINIILNKDYIYSIRLKDIIPEIIVFIKKILVATYENNNNKKTFEKKPITPLMEKDLSNSFTKGHLLENIKSTYFIQKLFLHLGEKIKLKTVKYNKYLQDKIDIKLTNYKFYSGKYIEYENNIEGKEYLGEKII